MIAAGLILIAAACLISTIAVLGMFLAWDRTPRRESHSELNHRIDAEAAAAAERYHGSGVGTMSAQGFKPGDVAIIKCSDGDWRPAFYTSTAMSGYSNWRFADGMLRDAGLSVARPLVVIDPESSADVERLTGALEQFITSGDDYADGVQAALREFASPTPPRPDEPTGLGAVVEDAEGYLWVLNERALTDTLWWRRVGVATPHWSAISAVRVLSEGVQP